MAGCEGFWVQTHEWTKWEKVTLKMVRPGWPGFTPTEMLYQERRCQKCGLYQLKRYDEGRA